MREASRLREMVEELLDFSRIESGRLVISRTVLDIVAELKDTIFMFEKDLPRTGSMSFSRTMWARPLFRATVQGSGRFLSI